MSKNDLTSYAIDGCNSPQDASCPYLSSSPAMIAWEFGRWMARTGRSMPRNVRMSRGYSLKANDMTIKWHGGQSFERIN